ncbi:MAG TPA: twin-arginine translocation signal domain-containing protein [Vicinamibacterales bacterium]|nr:twin-arginine translocation signal domain-containing protein [Vicinamibacterales bacterium]
MTQRKSNRRRFITGLGATAAAAGAGAITAHAQTPAGGHPQATRHATDDWMDALPNKHRMVVDGVTANGAGEAVLFASNLYAANKAAYQVGEGDLGIIVVMRHFATPFAFTDAMWAKYGKAMSAMLDFKDPKTKEAPTTNLFNSSAYGLTLPNLGNTIDALITRGTHFAVCDMAMHFAAGQLAQGGGGDATAIYKDFAANLVPNSHIVPAGVVAVNRAQERGYTLIYAG